MLVTSIGKKRVMTIQPTTSMPSVTGRLARAHSAKVKVCPVASFTMPSASGARAPPSSVATPPMVVPQAIERKSALA